jgi:hypothetical protein
VRKLPPNALPVEVAVCSLVSSWSTIWKFTSSAQPFPIDERAPTANGDNAGYRSAFGRRVGSTFLRVADHPPTAKGAKHYSVRRIYRPIDCAKACRYRRRTRHEAPALANLTSFSTRQLSSTRSTPNRVEQSIPGRGPADTSPGQHLLSILYRYRSTCSPALLQQWLARPGPDSIGRRIGRLTLRRPPVDESPRFRWKRLLCRR